MTDPKPDDLAGLLERLRDEQITNSYRKSYPNGSTHIVEKRPNPLCQEAADALERLTKELAAAERARDEAVEALGDVRAFFATVSRKLDEAVAERDRLRAIALAASAYREAESDATPRMWRGKALQDLANALDDALALPVAPVSEG